MKSKSFLTKVRRNAYRALARFDRLCGFETRQVVFCLHAVDEKKWRYSNTAVFIKNLVKAMMASGWEPGRLEDLRNNARWGRKNFYLTFDDGYLSVMRIAEWLTSRGVTPTVFLLSDPLKRDTTQLGSVAPLLGRQEIMKLKKLGWEFGSHSATHCDFYALNGGERLTHEITGSKQRLEKDYNIQVKYFAYPRGRYSNRVIRVVRESGYVLALSMDDGIISASSRRYKIPRIGLNSSHTVEEAMFAFSPSVIWTRMVIKAVLKSIKYL